MASKMPSSTYMRRYLAQYKTHGKNTPIWGTSTYGRESQQRTYTRWLKLRPPSRAIFQRAGKNYRSTTINKSIGKDQGHSDPVQEPDNDKTWPVMVTVDETHKIYTDHTGKFPITSSRGTKYILIMYVYVKSSNSEVVFYYTKQPPARWFFYFENQKTISNGNLFLLSDHSLFRVRRKTRDSLTLRGSSVPGKPMEPRIMTTGHHQGPFFKEQEKITDQQQSTRALEKTRVTQIQSKNQTTIRHGLWWSQWMKRTRSTLTIQENSQSRPVGAPSISWSCMCMLSHQIVRLFFITLSNPLPDGSSISKIKKLFQMEIYFCSQIILYLEYVEKHETL